MQHTPNHGHNLDYLHKYTPSLYIFKVTKGRISQKLILILFLRMFIQPIRRRKFGVFGIWTFYGML